MRRCDYMAYTISRRCQNEGIYGQPNFKISKEYPATDRWIRTLRWCEDHKQEGDYLIKEDQDAKD